MMKFAKCKAPLLISVLLSTVLLSGCDGDDGHDGINGIDGTNGVDGTNGTDGSNGVSALVNITELLAGNAQCPFGGQQIETGLDTNNNNVLDVAEVDASQTQVICNVSQRQLSVELVGRYQSDVYGLSAAEIVDYHAASQTAFVVNAQSGKVDLLDLSTLTQTPVMGEAGYTLNNITKLAELDLNADTGLALLGAVNSVSVSGDLLAAAVERADANGNATQGNGIVAFYRLSASSLPQYLSSVDVGALPDNVTFSPDGSVLLVANEGEPNSDYSVDPEGSVAIIDIINNSPANVATLVGFSDFNVGAARASELSVDINITDPVLQSPKI
ncbi:hypothetical protein N4T56_06325 [Shewanella sp. KJ10-1]|uniref:Collagen triple helix repeat (20 copies) n=1 Tax=Shewanella phaeophyticola TaxID=2978345 RepID=A0ABT2P0J6_9GAMM|nr:hypothetical protein [Shewanella sp. KJ10-1]